MKVLIVNGYSDSEGGKEAFKKFVVIVKKAFEYLRACGMEEPTYVILDRKNIDSYIYLKNSKYDNPEAVRLFDSADFVMMDGDANLLPWTKPAYKLGLLFKQCKRTDKSLFAAGFAFYMLIYYCATNFAHHNIVNGNGWGTKLEQIHNYPTAGLPTGAGFLDNETGDIYTFNSDNNTWLPSANTGLHYTRNATSAQIGQFVQNVKVYRGKAKIRDIYDVYKSNQNEAICFIKKSYVQHWALAGLPHKFLVEAKNAWDPHPVNVTQAGLVGPNYHALADNEKGPSIVEHKNTLATLFHIDPKHQETMQILESFVKHKITLIQNSGRIDLPLEIAELKEKATLCDPTWVDTEAKKLEALAKKHKVAFKATDARPNTAYTTEFKRSGLSYSKRLQSLVVSNNAVRSGAVEGVSIKKVKLKHSDAPSSHNSMVSSPPLLMTVQSAQFNSARPMSSHVRFNTTSLNPTKDKEMNTQRPKSPQRPDTTSSQRTLLSSVSSESSIRTIRKILHPFLPEEFATDFTQTVFFTIVYNKKARSMRSSVEGSMLSSASGFHKNKTITHPFTNFKQYTKMPKLTTEIVFFYYFSNKKPCVRTSGPYETAEERERREFLESKKNWVDKNNFKGTFKSGSDPKFIPNYVTRDPSNPPVLHKFREENKTKWIGGNFFV